RAMIEWLETNLNVEFVHAWGMTETSPIGCINHLKPKMAAWTPERKLDVKQRAGMIAPGLEIRIADDSGNDVPHDGVSMGRLLIRGPWVAGSYYKTLPLRSSWMAGLKRATLQRWTQRAI